MKRSVSIEIFVDGKLRTLDPFNPSLSLESFLRLADGVYRNCGTSSISILDHSLMVWNLMPAGVFERFRLFALWHDMAEVFLGDLPSPLKKSLQDFKALEYELLCALLLKYTPLRLNARELRQYSTALKEYDTKAYELERAGKYSVPSWYTALDIFRKQAIMTKQEQKNGRIRT